MTRQQQAQGKAGEDAAGYALAARGFRMIERVGTPVRLIRHPTLPGYYRPIYGEQVAGDIRAVGVGGQSVLAEVKTLDRNLRWSDFREHQPGKLTEHDDEGGQSLVVWVCGGDVFILEWRRMVSAGFGPRTSITADEAREIDRLTQR